MSYKTKPAINLYKYENNTFKLQSIIDDFQEVSFEHNLYEAGTFTISINYNIPNALKFARGLFVQFGNSYNFGEIISISDAIGEDGEGSQIRTITGYDARYLLKRRVIKNMNSNGLWAMTGKGELVLRTLINDQCGTNAEAKRQLPITNTIPTSENAIGNTYSVSESFSNLYEVCKTIATQSEIGWRIEFDGTNLNLVCYSGEDRSQTVRFDTDYESLAEGEFTDSSDAFSNAIYVGGKGQNDDRDIYEGEDAIGGNSPSGLDRFESWDNQSSMTTESEYEAEALSMLSQYGQTITLSGKGLAKCPYVFQEQYNIGDIITVAFSGKSAMVQILSVTEHWVWNEYDMEFNFGKPQPGLDSQLQLILNQIQKASNKTNSTDSVRWYTIPTDTAMPKADVTYNTIGFVGTVGTGATFTLYLDNEKTGAKTYHVYFKQLGGTGKLTLTTGKAGATNLTLNAGTYVAIIYVDENGNITNTASTPTATIEEGSTQPATSGGVQQAISQIAETNVIYDNTITDCNNMYQKGKNVVYWASSAITNVPNSNNAWFILSQCNPSTVSGYDYITQFAKSATSNSNEVYTRHAYLNNTTMVWTSWKRLLTEVDKYQNINAKPLSSAGWYKVAEVGYRNYGFSLTIDLFSNYANIPSSSHHIQINYSWLATKVVDNAKDANGVFDKIRICFNSNNTDIMAIYVHYKYASANGNYINISGCTSRFIPYNFETDSLTWDNTQEFNLGTNGIYEDGNKVTTTSDLHNYNADSSDWFDNLQKANILASFNAVANYNSFQGQTQAGQEGRWLGYRNNNYGCAIYMTRTRIIALYITGGEITKMKTIIDLS